MILLRGVEGGDLVGVLGLSVSWAPPILPGVPAGIGCEAVPDGVVLPAGEVPPSIAKGGKAGQTPIDPRVPASSIVLPVGVVEDVVLAGAGGVRP